MRKSVFVLASLALLSAGPASLSAQVRTIDPNQAIDSDLAPRPSAQSSQAAPQQPYRDPPAQDAAPGYQDQDAQSRYQDQAPPPESDTAVTQRSYQDGTPPREPDTARQPYAGAGPNTGPNTGSAPAEGARAQADEAAAQGDTFSQSELLSAAEGTFGKGAAGLAGILERTLKEQGRPNAYIAGKEGSGAIGVGLRYGKGDLFHKIEGQQPIYWTGPSLGFDLGGDANKVFVLVYNVYDTAELYKRFPAAEGRLYFVGGFAATYLRRGNIVLIPIRLGVGWRQGVNIGYMKFSHTNKWFPF